MPLIHPPSTRRRRVLVLLAVSGLVLASCGNSGDDEEADPSSADTTEDTTTESSAPETTEGDDEPTTTVKEEEEFVPVDAPGVTDEEIRYAVFGTFAANTPNATCALDCFIHGIEAYFAWRNSEGGVHGRQLVLDDPINDELGNNQVKALEILEADDTFGIFSYALLASGFADIAKAEVPLYTSVVSSPEVVGQESSFSLPGGAQCLTCPSKVNPYLAQELGSTSVASLAYGVAAASKDCSAGHKASFEKYGDAVGAELTFQNDDLAFGLPNGLATEVTAMRDAGVTLVLTCMDKSGVLTLAQELQRQGMTDTAVVVPEGYGSPTFFESSGGLFEGGIIGTPTMPFEADVEGTEMVEFQKWIEETGHADTEPTYAVWGWLAADTAYQGLVAAGPDFDRAKVVRATNQLEDQTAGGMMPPVDWTRQHEPATADDPVTHGPDPACIAFVRIGADDYELMTPPDKPWACWDPADADEYTDPEFTSFAEG